MLQLESRMYLIKIRVKSRLCPINQKIHANDPIGYMGFFFKNCFIFKPH